MYIYPNTTLKILHGVSLTNDYDHTIYFSTLSAQAVYFASKAKYTLNNLSYQRKERGWIQVDKNQNDLWDCTYLMYQNTAYKNKWFYAFILSIEYVNDNVSKINFEIDVMQTWHFDYILDQCFVEREHSTTDNMFENTINEKLDIGEFFNAQVVQEFRFNPSRLCVVCSEDNQEVTYPPTMQGNIFTGLGYASFDLSTAPNDAINYLSEYIGRGHEDAIVQIFQYPSFMGRIISSGQNITTYEEQNYTFTPNFVNVDGYVPKNKKLFSYPYNYMSVSDKEGKAIDLKWEYWNNNYRGQFKIQGCVFGKPTVAVLPYQYRDIGYDYENELVYDNFPVCAWSGDAFQVWLAQNTGKQAARLVGGIANMAIGGLSMAGGSVIRGPSLIASGATEILGVIGSALDAKEQTPKVHGESGSSVLNIQNGSSGFEFKQMTIRNEYAKIIDEYFSRFGYACHRIKVPNRNARQYWTYTKTIECEISNVVGGGVPSDDAVKIKSIYNNGITFWNNGDEIGNYSAHGDFNNPVYL